MKIFIEIHGPWLGDADHNGATDPLNSGCTEETYDARRKLCRKIDPL